MTTTPLVDAVDAILGSQPGSFLDELRRRKPVTRENTQASFLALFHPVDDREASLQERFAVAFFVAELHGQGLAADFYRKPLRDALLATDDGGAPAAVTGGLETLLGRAASAGAGTGPYGEYREPGLRGESLSGPRFELPPGLRSELGARLAAALEHAHSLVFRPRESSPEALRKLLDAGWSTSGIVTLSQLVAFLAYQLRVISGLQVLAAASESTESLVAAVAAHTTARSDA
ncbi:CMD domain protein [Arthrobacter bambusae]